MPAGFTPLDVGLFVLAMISGLLAMYRGLTREVLSILSWALAAAAALYFVLYQKAMAEQLAEQFFNGSVPLAQIAAAALIFVIVRIVVHLVTVRFSEAVLDSRVGLIDRLLGFLFGVARGFLLVAIAYTLIVGIAGDKVLPAWLQSGQSLPYIKQTGDAITELTKAYLPENLQLPGASASTEASPPEEAAEPTTP